jgi:hypothetical protein
MTLGLACRCALSDGVPRRSFFVALVVGTVLNLINQGDSLFGAAPINWLKVILTYFVPYADVPMARFRFSFATCVVRYACDSLLLWLQRSGIDGGPHIGTESIADRRFERVTGNAQANAHPAQHDSFATSLSKDNAASFRPSTVVR